MKGVFLLSFLLAVSANAQQRMYSVRDIDPGIPQVALDDSDRGDLSDTNIAVGRFQYDWNGSQMVPSFHLSQAYGFFNLGFAPNGSLFEVARVNKQGVAIGGVSGVVGYTVSPGAGYRELLPIEFGRHSVPAAINANGLVVGYCRNAWSYTSATYWDTNFKAQLVDPTLSLLTDSTSRDVNLSAQIAVTVRQGSIYRSFLYSSGGGRVEFLPFVSGDSVQINHINDSGAGIGSSGVAQVYWSSHNQPVPIPVPQGFNAFNARDINNDSVVVGNSYGPTQEATIWVPGEQPYFLRNRIDAATSDSWSQLFGISGINNNGAVIGYGSRNINGQIKPRMFIATPLPNTSDVAPVAWQLFRGQIVSGGDLSFLLNKDGQYMVARPGLVLNQSEAPVQLIVDGTCPSGQVTELRCKARLGVNSPSLRVETLLFDWTGGTYVRVDERAATQSDMDLDIPIANPGNFIRSSDRLVKMKLSIRAAGPVPNPVWQARFDFTGWTAVLP